ncbi:MAG: M20/M25/M40 family metallo-hydrolase [Actinobacteria bacterium]|nr:M20/M25/M40 family metallo-hydrolase [Actinomycetota bacterium]
MGGDLMTSGPNDVLDLLAKMISFDTVNEYTSGVDFPERTMMEYLEEIAKGWGLETSRLPIPASALAASYNLLITYEVSKTAQWLVFESHADTVSVDGMTVNPFQGLIKDGVIYGRGACDTKGSGAGMLWALKEYMELSTCANNIAVLFVTDEEATKTGTTAFVQTQLEHLDWTPTGVIVGEPTLCQPVVAHNGVIRWKVSTQGVAAHSSNPSNGQSAISAMSKLILEFEKEYCSKISLTHPLTGQAACSVNTISGGTAVNIIPNFCEIEIDRRTLPGEDSEQVLKDMKAVLDSISLRDPTILIGTSTPFIDYPLDPIVNHGFAMQISQILIGMGLSSEQSGAGYGTDASTYSIAGIPAVVIGPGSINQAHTKDEWLEIAELDKSVLIYKQIMGYNFI